MTPEVSVVIPTRNRPELLRRALRSAFAQEGVRTEVVVVIDGPDERTLQLLTEFAGPNLVLVQNPQPLGGGASRNAGIEATRAHWVALLDDDDEWTSDKLKRQLEAVRKADGIPIVSCRLWKDDGAERTLYPLRLPSEGQRVDEFLFAPVSITRDDGGAQTSSLMAPRELFLEVPFDGTLRRHQDWDWLLRAATLADVNLVFVDAALGTWHVESGRTRVSNEGDWKYSLDWARTHRQYFSPRAYSGFLLTVVSVLAAKERQYRALPVLLREALQHGKPDLIQLARLSAVWAVPRKMRRLLRPWAGLKA